MLCWSCVEKNYGNVATLYRAVIFSIFFHYNLLQIIFWSPFSNVTSLVFLQILKAMLLTKIIDYLIVIV